MLHLLTIFLLVAVAVNAQVQPARTCLEANCFREQRCVVDVINGAHCVDEGASVQLQGNPQTLSGTDRRCRTLTCTRNQRCEVSSRGVERCVTNNRVQTCKTLRCPRGQSCETTSRGATCVVDRPTCATLRCPSHERCVENSREGAMCQSRGNSLPSSGSCAMIACMPGYQCVINQNGRARCVRRSSNPSCGRNASFNECASDCPPTCSNRRAPTQPCRTICRQKCECDRGFVLNERTGECVNSRDC